MQLTTRQALILSCKTELEHWQGVSASEQPDPGIASRRQLSCSLRVSECHLVRGWLLSCPRVCKGGRDGGSHTPQAGTLLGIVCVWAVAVWAPKMATKSRRRLQILTVAAQPRAALQVGRAIALAKSENVDDRDAADVRC